MVTGVPVTRPTAPPVPAFDAFSSQRPGQPEAPAGAQDPYAAAYPDFGAPGTGPSAPNPGPQPSGGYESGSAYQNGTASPGSGAYQNQAPYQGQGTYQDVGSYPGSGQGYQEDTGYTGGPAHGGDRAYGNEGSTGNHDGITGSRGERYRDATNGDGFGVAATSDDGEYKGLPRRVRQASLAPQLRASAAAAGPPEATVPQAAAASLTDMRNTLSAMQRGWQQGRSQTQGDTEGDADGN